MSHKQPRPTGPGRIHRYASTVEAFNTVHPTAIGDLGTIGNNHMVNPNS